MDTPPTCFSRPKHLQNGRSFKDGKRDLQTDKPALSIGGKKYKENKKELKRLDRSNAEVER